MAINLEFDPIKSHFASCKIQPNSHSKYRSYDWSFIMSNEDFWYRMAERALARHDLERCASICFQWMLSFTDAFNDDAFNYSDDRFVFRIVLEWFSDMILKAYDDEEVTDELRLAIIAKYDQLNKKEILNEYALFDINDIIETRCWPIETIEFHTLNQENRESKEAEHSNQTPITQSAEGETQFVCYYESPSERFKCESGLNHDFKDLTAKDPDLSQKILSKLRDVYNTSLEQNHKEELIQHLDGQVREAHLQALNGETAIASKINDATILLISEIRQDKKFLKWIGDDLEVFDELDKILSNAIKLKNYLMGKQKTEVL